MPTYVYECQTCLKTIEVEQRVSDEPLNTCECGGPLKKLIQPTAVLFKGSGFHINDYSGSGAPSEPKSEQKAEPKVETTTESKPEAAPKPDIKD